MKIASHNEMRRSESRDEVEAQLLIVIPVIPDDQYRTFVQALLEAFEGAPLRLALPDTAPDVTSVLSNPTSGNRCTSVSYAPGNTPVVRWVYTPHDYIVAYELMKQTSAPMVLMVGAEAQSVGAADLAKLYHHAVDHPYDLVTGNYNLSARVGLVNSAVIYPTVRALFGTPSRYPLAPDLCLSSRMLKVMVQAAQTPATSAPSDHLLWPVLEASASGLTVSQAPLGTRRLPQPPNNDLNDIISRVLGSLFSEVESKAASWQRTRAASITRPNHLATEGNDVVPQTELVSMLDGFHLGYANILDIWSLFLPPQSLLGLKRLHSLPLDTFRMPDSLWVRLVYDFLVAYRMRTINRTHLLGSFTPLYLAWVVSHLTQVAEGLEPEEHIERLAITFESEKPYLLGRWRWPDRFNP